MKAGHEGEPQISSRSGLLRREALKVLLGGLVGSISAIEDNRVQKPIEKMRRLPRGKYLAPLSGFEIQGMIGEEPIPWRFVVWDRPVPLRIDFIQEGADFLLQEPFALKYGEEGKISLYREPKFRSEGEIVVESDAIKTDYAAYVSGEVYRGGALNPRLGTMFRPHIAIARDSGGEDYLGGQWHVLVDYEGKHVDPNGVLLEKGEKPYYLPSVFVRKKRE